RLARRHRLGLAVVDVHLLDMTGCDLVRQLRAIEPGLPVVLTSGDYRPTTEVEARQLGIVQYIHKPADLHRLELVFARLFAAFGAAAHRARLMEEPMDPSASRQDERFERRQIFLTASHEAFELLHLAFAHSEHALVDGVGRRRQLAAEVEELVLDLPEDFVEPAVALALADPLGVEDPHQADDRVQLIDRAVGDDARRVLRDSLPADPGGLAMVAGPGVHARDVDRYGFLR